MHGKGLIPLPDPGGRDLFVRKNPEQQPDIPEGIEKITGSLAELGRIEITPIEIGDRSASRIWNGLMEKFHYLGAGPLCGAQIRYLIKSSSCGWSEEARKKNLSKVICNSRFPLVPKIPNLASHILSRVVQRIKDDWNARYSIDPALIETYVNQENFRGTCYQAANWSHIGSTKGRGRMDRANAKLRGIKDVYTLALTRNFREILCTTDIGATLPIIVQTPTKETPVERMVLAVLEVDPVDGASTTKRSY